MDASPSSTHPSSRPSTPDDTRVGSSATSAASTSTNIWDSAWAACTQQPPPNLTEVLGAYAQKGDGDREMLLGILKAKSAEDQRIAAIASLHQTILQLQSQALSAAATPGPVASGRDNGTASPPMPSPLPPPPRRGSVFGQAMSVVGRKDPSPTLHSALPPATSSSSSSMYSQQSHPQLPPISTMGSAYPDRRSRVGPPPRTSSPARHSPDYPLSPYSTNGGPDRRSPRSASALPTSMPSLRPAPYPPASQGRLAMAALTNEEDGDLKYRRMTIDRKAR